jgi:hypothetical protein
MSRAARTGTPRSGMAGREADPARDVRGVAGKASATWAGLRSRRATIPRTRGPRSLRDGVTAAAVELDERGASARGSEPGVESRVEVVTLRAFALDGYPLRRVTGWFACARQPCVPLATHTRFSPFNRGEHSPVKAPIRRRHAAEWSPMTDRIAYPWGIARWMSASRATGVWRGSTASIRGGSAPRRRSSMRIQRTVCVSATL